MKISISTVSEDRLFLRLTGKVISIEQLNNAFGKIKRNCHIQIQRLVGSQIIVLERKDPEVDLHLSAGKLLAELN